MTFNELLFLLPSLLPVFVLAFLVAAVGILIHARRQLLLLRGSVLAQGELLDRGEHPGGRWYLLCRVTNPYTQETETVEIPCAQDEWSGEKGAPVPIRFMGRYQPTLDTGTTQEAILALRRRVMVWSVVCVGVLGSLMALSWLILRRM